MKTDGRIIEIIEDHAVIVDTLNSIACAIKTGIALPNFLPMLNDTVTADLLGVICEFINKSRRV